MKSKVVLKNKENSIKEYSSNYAPIIIRKEINFLGKALIIGIICFTASYLGRSPEKSKRILSQTSNTETPTIQIESSLSETNSGLINQLNNRIIKQEKELNRFKREIASLKTINIKPKEVIKESDYIKPIFKEEIIPLNSANLSILYKAHTIELKRLKDKLMKTEKHFLSTHNMELAESQRMLRDLKDNHELQLHALKSRYYEKRNQFKANKYLVNNSY